MSFVRFVGTAIVCSCTATAGRRGTGQPVEVATPPVFIVFDLLYLKGRDLSGKPLRDRKS